MKIRKQTLDNFLIELEKISGYGMMAKKKPSATQPPPVKVVDNASIEKVISKNPSLVGTKPSVAKLSDNKYSVGDVTFDTFDSAKAVSDYLKNQ